MSHYALWLLPSHSKQRELQSLIDHYVSLGISTRFLPHITLASGLSEPPSSTQWHAAKHTLPLLLDAPSLSHEPHRFRRFYLRINSSPPLLALRQSLCAHLRHTEKERASFSEFHPHLSLIYADVSNTLALDSLQQTLPLKLPQRLSADRVAWVNCQGTPDTWSIIHQEPIGQP